MADNQDAIELQRRARRRLVGAIALVVFVVIALPIVFDREPKPITQDLTIQIPSQDSGKFSSRLLPPQPEAKADTKAAATAPAVGAPAAPVAEKPAPIAKDVAPSPAATASRADTAKDVSRIEAPKESAKPEPVKSEPAKPVTTAAPKATVPAAAPLETKSAKADTAKSPAPATVATAPTITASGAESFIVPLGLFRNTGNVDKVRGWVNSAGFKSFTEAAPDKNGVKVMAGPFASREAAEKARDKLKAKGVDVGPVAAR